MMARTVAATKRVAWMTQQTTNPMRKVLWRKYM